MSLTTGEQTTIRAARNAHKVYASISVPRVLLSATAGNLAKGATAISYTSGTGTGFADIQAGHTLKVVNAVTTEYVRIKSASGSQSSGTITVAANPVTWGSGAAITVLEEFRLWPLLPRFTEDGTFYKDWDTPYSTQNNSINDVVLADHRAGFMPASGTYTYTEDLTRSYPLAGALITGYALALYPSVGTSITDNLDGTFDVEITATGQYWQRATVTNTLGTSTSSWRRVIVEDAGNLAYDSLEVRSWSGSTERGWNIDLEMFGTDVSETAVPEESLLLVWQEQLLNGAAATYGARSGAENLLFAGYISRSQVTSDGQTTVLTVQARSVIQLLSEIYIASISLEATANATTWYEYIYQLSTGRALHHLLKWHTTLLEIASVVGLNQDYNIYRYFAEMQAGQVDQTARDLLQAIFSTLSCDKTGQVVARRNVQLMNQTERDAVATGWTVTKLDMAALEVQDKPPGASTVFVSGIRRVGVSVTSAKPVLSKAPGDRYGWGRGPMEIGNLVIPDQSWANNLSGRLLAVEQQPYGAFRWSNVSGAYLPALDVTQDEWLALTLDGSETTAGLSFTAWRCLVHTIEVRYDPANALLALTLVEAVPEAYGYDGETEIWPSEPPDTVDDIGLPPLPALDPLPEIIFDGEPPEILLPPVLGNLVAWGSAMGVYWLGLGGLGWEARNAALTGGSGPGCVDPWRVEPDALGGLSEGQTPLWRCETGKIYRSVDAGVTWLDVTPLDDPPNSWGDATAPTVTDLEFSRVVASLSLAGTFFVTAIWQETDTVNLAWRSWTLTTSDYGQTWSWETLLVIPASAPQDITFDFGDGAQGWLGATEPGGSSDTAVWDGTTHVGVSTAEPVATVITDQNPAYGSDYTSRCGATYYNGGVAVATGWNGNYTWSATRGYVNSFSNLGIVYSQKLSCSGVTIVGEHSRSEAFGNESHWARLYSGASPDISASYAHWTELDKNTIWNIGDGSYQRCYSTTLTGAVSNEYIRLRSYWQNTNFATRYIRNIVFSVTIHDAVLGPTEFRIVYANSDHIIAIADDELNLYDSSLGLIAKIADCTNAEWDAGTYTAGSFSPLDDDQVVFVYGRFDATNGTIGLTGVQHIVASADGGSTWATLESGWSTDTCGAFFAGYDSGSGARYWAIRNASGTAQLYSDILSLTYISDIAAFAVGPDNFHILDGQTMAVAGLAADGATIVFETYDGGATWTDITGTLPITGVNKVSYA